MTHALRRLSSEDITIGLLTAALDEQLIGTHDNSMYARHLERQAYLDASADLKIRYPMALAIVMGWQENYDEAVVILLRRAYRERLRPLVAITAQSTVPSIEKWLLSSFMLAQDPSDMHGQQLKNAWKIVTTNLVQRVETRNGKTAMAFVLGLPLRTEEPPTVQHPPIPSSV